MIACRLLGHIWTFNMLTDRSHVGRWVCRRCGEDGGIRVVWAGKFLEQPEP